MDLLPLILPSILFAVLQHRSDVHAREVKSRKKEVKKRLPSQPANNRDAHILDLMKNEIDYLLAMQPTGVYQPLILFFALYLLVIAVLHVAASLGFNILDYAVFEFNAFNLTQKSILSIYMMILVIWLVWNFMSIWREAREANRINKKSEEYLAVARSLWKNAPPVARSLWENDPHAEIEPGNTNRTP